jgi:hypothetical protein
MEKKRNFASRFLHYSLYLGAQTTATASGIINWYEQWVCKSTLDKKAVCVG